MTEETMYFDNSYTETRFRYGLTYRPAAFANVPSGFIIASDRPDSRFTYGTLDYPAPLSAETVKSYDLTYVGQFDHRRPGIPCDVVLRDAMQLSSGTISVLTGHASYVEIDAARDRFVAALAEAQKAGAEYRNWQHAWAELMTV